METSNIGVASSQSLSTLILSFEGQTCAI